MTISQKYSKNIYLKYAILFFSIVVSFLFVWFGPEVWGGVVALGILVIVAFVLSNFNFLSPLMWFPPFLFLYSIADPVLVAIGDRPYKPMLGEVMFIQWVAMLTFILVLGYKNKKPEYNYNPEKLRNIKLVAQPLFVISLLFTSIYMAYVYRNGLTSKYDISLLSSPITRFSLFFSLITVTYALLLCHSILIKKKFPKKLVAFTLGYMFFALLIIGERDLALRIIVVTLFIHHVLYKPLKTNQLFLAGGIGLSLIPIMSKFKNFIVDDTNSRLNQPQMSFLSQLLGTEFGAAAKNLQTLISRDNVWSYKYGETFLWDLKVVIGTGDSSVMWFNERFFPHLVARGGGNGFTLVGQGYLNFGILGVILTFIVLALMLKLLYNRAQKSLFWLIVYIISIPLAIYMIRADLSTYLTQTIKQIILPLALIYLSVNVLEIVVRKNRGSVLQKQLRDY